MSDWRDRAECLNHDPELFFPIGESRYYQLQIERAIEVCKGCPVVEECLTFAVETKQTHGVWGAMSEKGLDALRRRANRRKYQPTREGNRGNQPRRAGAPVR